MLVELMMHEIGSRKNESLKYYSLLKALLKEGKITKAQYTMADRIRKIRNQYVHLDLNELYERVCSSGLGIEINGKVTMLKEYIDNSHTPNERLLEVHALFTQQNAEYVLTTTKELLTSLEIPA